MKTKPGYKTTEFYLMGAAAIAGLLASGGVFEPETCSADWCGVALKALGLVIAGLAAMGYTYIRGKVKATDTFAEASKGSGSDPS